MNTWVDRRAIVFFVFAAVCGLLVWPCPDQFRWVGITICVAYLVLGVLSWADHLARWKSFDKH